MRCAYQPSAASSFPVAHGKPRFSSIGPIAIRWGAFLGALINFAIIALVAFLIAKKMLREKKASKK